MWMKGGPPRTSSNEQVEAISSRHGRDILFRAVLQYTEGQLVRTNWCYYYYYGTYKGRW